MDFEDLLRDVQKMREEGKPVDEIERYCDLMIAEMNVRTSIRLRIGEMVGKAVGVS